MILLLHTGQTGQFCFCRFCRHQAVPSFLCAFRRSMIHYQISSGTMIQAFHPDIPIFFLKHNCFSGIQYLYLSCSGKFRELRRRISIRNENLLHLIAPQKVPGPLQIFRMQIFKKQYGNLCSFQSENISCISLFLKWFSICA